MDLAPTTSQEEFRAECRSWLERELPWEYGVGFPPMFDDLGEEVAFLRDWQEKLAGARMVGVSWPREYGGQGLEPLHHFIVQEELARARAPELVGRIGVNLVGPTLLAHGTEDQKARWLPAILPAHQLFCQLFSEPNAGSDLASVATRATRVDGGWVLTGQKVWSSSAQFADWGLCLARTESRLPKREGISAFMVDMSSPGIEVRPLRERRPRELRQLHVKAGMPREREQLVEVGVRPVGRSAVPEVVDHGDRLRRGGTQGVDGREMLR